MFRLAPFKNNNLSDVEVKVTLAISTEENGKLIDKFFDLELEFSKINGLSLSWTIVHPIDDKSPFYEFSKEDITNTDMEIMVYVKAFDSVFSNNVTRRTSYVSSEIVWGAKFRLMYHPSDDKSKTILDLEKLNEFDPAELPQPVTVS